MKISIVIPGSQEEGIVGKTVHTVPLDKVHEHGLETEIIVVDNASTDNTAKEAQEAGARVVLGSQRGYGNAYLKGFSEATGDIVVMGITNAHIPFHITYDLYNPSLRKADL